MADVAISIYRGEGKTWSGAATNNGAVVNLLGSTVYFTVYPDYPASTVTTDAGATIKKLSSVAGEITLTDPTNGLFEVALVKADTNSLTPGDFVYGIEVMLSGATSPVVLGQGIITVLADVVRAV
jgi:hypothetical protein